jgi:hypothetical protein
LQIAADRSIGASTPPSGWSVRARRTLLVCALLCVAVVTTLAIAVAGERSARLPRSVGQ